MAVRAPSDTFLSSVEPLASCRSSAKAASSTRCTTSAGRHPVASVQTTACSNAQLHAITPSWISCRVRRPASSFRPSTSSVLSSPLGPNVSLTYLRQDLAWHTHQLKETYKGDTVTCTRRFIDHDDKVEENALANGFDVTARAWEVSSPTLTLACSAHTLLCPPLEPLRRPLLDLRLSPPLRRSRLAPRTKPRPLVLIVAPHIPIRCTHTPLALDRRRRSVTPVRAQCAAAPTAPAFGQEARSARRRARGAAPEGRARGTEEAREEGRRARLGPRREGAPICVLDAVPARARAVRVRYLSLILARPSPSD